MAARAFVHGLRGLGWIADRSDAVLLPQWIAAWPPTTVVLAAHVRWTAPSMIRNAAQTQNGSLRAAVVQVVTALVLVAGTAAVVRAQPTQATNQQTIATQPGVVPASVKAAIDALKPVQLPIWSTAPTGYCTLGEMAMVAENLSPARLFVCKGHHAGVGVSSTHQTVNSCAGSDAECTQHGGVPYNPASAPNSPPCVGYNGTRACAFQRQVCAQWSLSPATHWEVVTTARP